MKDEIFSIMYVFLLFQIHFCSVCMKVLVDGFSKTNYNLATEKINRTTFYKYYGSQYELLDEIEENYFEKLENFLTEDNSEAFDGLTDALCFLEGEKERWRILINTVSDEEFANRLFNLPIIRRLLDENIGTEIDENKRSYIRLFICHGSYAIIRQWVNQENGEAPEEIAKMIYSLVRNTI